MESNIKVQIKADVKPKFEADIKIKIEPVEEFMEIIKGGLISESFSVLKKIMPNQHKKKMLRIELAHYLEGEAKVKNFHRSSDLELIS